MDEKQKMEAAIKAVKGKFPDRKVFKVGKYKNGYLVLCGRTNMEKDRPFQLVVSDIANDFSPIDDFEGFDNAFGPGLLMESEEGY